MPINVLTGVNTSVSFTRQDAWALRDYLHDQDIFPHLTSTLRFCLESTALPHVGIITTVENARELMEALEPGLPAYQGAYNSLKRSLDFPDWD